MLRCIENPTRRHSARFLVLILIAVTCGLQPAHGELLWSDEFDSGEQPDSGTWSYDLGSSGWGNQELQEYTSNSENVRIDNGHLLITARRKMTGNTVTGFTSARIKTQDKLMFRYGTLEARIRIPNLADGLWPAFWTLGNSISTVGWPSCGELDVMEMGHSTAIADGKVNRRVGATAHWEHQNAHALYGLTLDAPVNLNDDFHVYRMEWTPQHVRSFLDGVQIWEMDITPAKCTDCTELHEPHFILLNLAIGGNYPGLLSNAQITAPMPAEMQVDYVRIYDNGHTELSGPASETGPPDIGPAHSGSWFNETQSGHGFSMEFGELQDEQPFAVIYWYNYDTLGNPIFFLGTGIPEGNVIEVTFESPIGMVFGEFDPNAVIRENGGTARFEFSDRDNALFWYTPSEFSTTQWGHSAIDGLPLLKLFGIPVSGD